MSKLYSMEEIEKFVVSVDLHSARQTDISKAKESSLVSGSGSGQLQSTYDADSEAIYAGCGWFKGQIDNPEGQSYDNWLAVGRILSRCKNGEYSFHRHSRRDSRYDVDETQSKFEEGRDNLRPSNCQGVQKQLNSTSCKDCPVQHTVNSPMAFGSSDPAIAALQSEFVLDVQTQRFISLKSGATYSEKAFRAGYGHIPDKGSISNILIGDHRTGKVEREGYEPGNSDILVEKPEGWVLNGWRDTGIEPIEGDFSIIQKHREMLIPDSSDREHLEKYQAYHLQNPGTKIMHVILIAGSQGTGKSFEGELFKAMVGTENVTFIEQDQLNSQWRERWGNSQVAIVEEMMTQNRLEFYNETKAWITQETCTAEEKHIAARQVMTPRVWFIFTNHWLATCLPKDDRRYFVIHSDMEPQSPEYYNRLWTEGMAQAAAYKHYLLSLDVSDFNPSAPAPMTDAKLQMIEDSRAPLEAELAAMVAEAAYPFGHDLVRLEEVRSALKARLGESVRHSAFTAAVRACGFVRREGQVPLSNKTKPRLWVIRNHDHWLDCTAKDIRREMDRPIM